VTSIKPAHPLFELYTMEDIADRTGYSLQYLLSVREGRKAANQRFRRTVCGILKRPDSMLFTTETEPTQPK